MLKHAQKSTKWLARWATEAPNSFGALRLMNQALLASVQEPGSLSSSHA